MNQKGTTHVFLLSIKRYRRRQCAHEIALSTGGRNVVKVKDPTHRYQFSNAGERQIDVRNPFRNIREVPYERALKLFATRRLG